MNNIRLIDANALMEYCSNQKTKTISNNDIARFPTVSVVDITQRDLCKDISCTDCPFMKETCKLMDYVAYADRPHGEWIFEETDEHKRTYCSECGVSAPFVCVSGDYYGRRLHGETRKTKFCPNCGAKMT